MGDLAAALGVEVVPDLRAGHATRRLAAKDGGVVEQERPQGAQLARAACHAGRVVGVEVVDRDLRAARAAHHVARVAAAPGPVGVHDVVAPLGDVLNVLGAAGAGVVAARHQVRVKSDRQACLAHAAVEVREGGVQGLAGARRPA